MKYIIPICLLLAGCATVPPAQAPAPRHLVVKAPPIVTAPAIAIPPAATPMTKQTFRHRWLSKFFRDRAK